MRKATRLTTMAMALVATGCPPPEPGVEATVSDPLTDTFDVTSAWIKSVELSEGTVVAGFTVQSSPTVQSAAWAVSDGTWPSNPQWTAKPWFFAGEEWPTPSNFCDLFDFPGGAAWETYSYVGATLWTGLNDQAVLVTLGGQQMFPFDDIALVSSIDRGNTFTKSTIVTVNDESAIGIDPESIHASLLVKQARGTADDGSFPGWIYLVWRNDNGWWTTKVLYGVGAQFVQPQEPKKLTAIPSEIVANVSIQAWEDDNDDVVVDVGWSDTRDGQEIPALPPACPSTERRTVEWKLSFTRDYDSDVPTWACPEDHGDGKCEQPGLLIHRDEAYKRCSGPNINSLRPQLGVNNKADAWRWYYVISRSVDDKGAPMRVEMFQDALTGSEPHPYQRTFLSDGFAGEDAEADELSPQLAVHRGTIAAFPIVGLTWKAARSSDGFVSIRTAVSTQFGDGGSWEQSGALSGASWSPTTPVGTRHGLVVQQLCVDASLGTCPGQPAAHPNVRFHAVWPQTLNDVSVVRGRTFIPSP